MKYFTLIMLFLSVSLVTAQKEYKLSHTGGTLILKGVDGATITAYEGSEIIISNTDHIDPEKEERAKGLRALNSMGLFDNTGLGLSIEKEEGNVVISQIGQCQCGGHGDTYGYKIRIPKSMKIDYSHSKHSAETIAINDVNEEIIVSMSYGNVKLSNVTGPMSIKTVYGSIEADFSKLTSTNAISLYSVYDFVDVTLPSNSKADLNIKAPYGEMYSDLDIKVASYDDSEMRSLSTKSMTGTINGGGIDMSIKSGYDNVYLRKK